MTKKPSAKPAYRGELSKKKTVMGGRNGFKMPAKEPKNPYRYKPLRGAITVCKEKKAMQQNLFDANNSKPQGKPTKTQGDKQVGQGFSKEYLVYLKSSEWKKRRKAALERVGYRCERCHKPFVLSRLQVHHLTYVRLGKELPTDIKVLCDDCHGKADIERRADKEARIYESQVYGWANKVYGEDWERFKDFEEVADEFDEWLERKEMEDEGYDDDSGDY